MELGTGLVTNDVHNKPANPRDDRPTAQDAGAHTGFALCLTAVFLILGTVLLLHHELWRDEAQPWLIACKSRSIAELLYNRRYEGHPALWYVIVYLVTRFSHQVQAMQVVHLIIEAAAIYLFARFAPFTRLQKTLFAFGYYFFFQYAIVCRNYGIGILLVFAFCALFPHRNRRLLPLAGLLFLLANTSALGWCAAGSLGLALFLTMWTDRESRRTLTVPKWEIATSVFVVILGLAVAGLMSYPPHDSGVYHPHTELGTIQLIKALDMYAGSYLLLPTTYGQYGSMIPMHKLVDSGQVIFSIAVMAYLCLVFVRRRIILLTYFAWIAGLMSIYMFVWGISQLRHGGFVVLAMISCLWLAGYVPERGLKSAFLDRLSARSVKYSSPLLLLLLGYQLVGGAGASAIDVLRPYSCSKTAAQYIMDHNLGNLTIIADEDDPASSVAAYIPKKFYYPASGSFGTNIIRSTSRKSVRCKNEALQSIDKLTAAGNDSILLLLNYPLSANDCREHGLRFLKSFTGSAIRNEEYWIYIASNGGTS